MAFIPCVGFPRRPSTVVVYGISVCVTYSDNLCTRSYFASLFFSFHSFLPSCVLLLAFPPAPLPLSLCCMCLHTVIVVAVFRVHIMCRTLSFRFMDTICLVSVYNMDAVSIFASAYTAKCTHTRGLPRSFSLPSCVLQTKRVQMIHIGNL